MRTNAMEQSLLTVDDIRHAVYKGDYWGAIFAQDGASTRLASALRSGDAARAW